MKYSSVMYEWVVLFPLTFSSPWFTEGPVVLVVRYVKCDNKCGTKYMSASHYFQKVGLALPVWRSEVPGWAGGG